MQKSSLLIRRELGANFFLLLSLLRGLVTFSCENLSSLMFQWVASSLRTACTSLSSLLTEDQSASDWRSIGWSAPKGMEPLAQRSRRLRLVIALAQGKTFRLKPRTRGNGSSQGPGLSRGVYDLILPRDAGDGWDDVSHATHTSTQSPSAINALAASPLCRTK